MWEEYIAKLLEEDGLLTTVEYQKGLSNSVDLLTCIDGALEAGENDLASTIRDLHFLTRLKLFVAIRFDRTKYDAKWWKSHLDRLFYFSCWQVRPGFVYGEAIPKTRELRVGRRQPQTGKRRPMTPEWAAQIAAIKQHNNSLTDAFSQIHEVRMWESVEDEAADMHVVCNILEYLPLGTLDWALQNIASLSRKAVLITIKLDERRSPRWWRQIFEQRFRLASCEVGSGHMLFVGAPAVYVDGVQAVGAMASDDRWEQIKQACARFSGRIPVAPAHDRRAILVCYGPSLTETIDKVRPADGDIFTASGAHDFLLENGIIPHAHIECDPRPHKADNMKESHPFVRYMLASACHPRMFDKVADCPFVELWHVSTPEHALRFIEELGEKPQHIISGGGSVGLRAIPLLYALGYRKISIHGMDCSFTEGGMNQHAGEHAGKLQDLCEVTCGDQTFIASPVLLTYATGFFEVIQKVTDLEIRLYGHGLLQSMALLYAGSKQTENVSNE